MLPPDEARAYFGSQGDCDVAEDLSKLTPYHAYWKYYRARLMTGNSYLWEPRRSAVVVGGGGGGGKARGMTRTTTCNPLWQRR